MGGPPAVLTRPRVVAAVALGAALAAYYAWHESLPNVPDWPDVAILSLLLIPAAFGLVYLALPLRLHRGLLPVGIALALLAFALHRAHLYAGANFAKLGATTAIGFWFLGYFETAGWVVLVALIVPWVDAYSVWRGPTKVIVTEHRHVFTTLSFAFPIPGERGAANLGLPDLLFFALFLAASARFGLRVRLTWLLLTLSFGATMALAFAFDVGGLPALPLLSLGFLLANCDLLWTRIRADRARAASEAEA